MTTYKFKIIGDNGVGKTTFITRLKTGAFSQLPVDNQEIDWENGDKIQVTTNQNDHSDGVILMFDVHNPDSFDLLEPYFNSDKPTVLVGNKIDIKITGEHENRWYVKKWRQLQNGGTNMKFYEISAKSNYNFEKPFNSLINKIN